MTSRPRIAIAIGDPAGIGPEIALRAVSDPQTWTRCVPLIVGSAGILARHAAGAGIAVTTGPGLLRCGGREIRLVEPAGIDEAAIEPGQVSIAAGAAIVAYTRAAVELARLGDADAVVACPHNETAVNAAGVTFDGYGGLVADLLGWPRDKVFLMLVADRLRVVNVTLHVSLKEAIAALSVDRVVAAAHAASRALQRLGVERPRIGVAGLNPHAGEGGLFGNEEAEIITPAVAAARSDGLDIDGPIGADVLLPARRHDVVLAMYHDQAHIAVKMIAPAGAAALSIGLPVAFASVAHGSAHDIAGTGKASARALSYALAVMTGGPGPGPGP